LIISIDAKKTFDKIQHHFMINALRKLGIEGMYLNVIKTIHEKHIASIILNGGGQTETILPKLRNETRVPTLPTHSVIPSQSNNGKRRNKRNTNR
jgi:hypothetical protein